MKEFSFRYCISRGMTREIHAPHVGLRERYMHLTWDNARDTCISRGITREIPASHVGLRERYLHLTWDNA